MNGKDILTIITAITTAIIAIVGAMHHEDINNLQEETVPRHEIHGHVDDLHTWNKQQDERLNQLEMIDMENN